MIRNFFFDLIQYCRMCVRVCACVCSGDGGDGLEKEEEEATVLL